MNCSKCNGQMEVSDIYSDNVYETVTVTHITYNCNCGNEVEFTE